MNFDSREWAEVVENIDQAIEAAKERLCLSLPETRTAYIRGGIAYLRQLRDWPQAEVRAAQEEIERSKEPGLDFQV
jgi:hypothetical protein